MIKDTVVLLYNLYAIVAWTTILYLLIKAAVDSESFEAWGDTYEEDSYLRTIV